ncbi:FecR domain-containing protein [Candidatus Peregrinibacteria bacterium]|nr:FecR domain-containing protein [Candidatus Peregrinibacteria bacterium]
MYQRRPIRKSVFSYIMPLVVIIAIFLMVILGWKMLNIFFGTSAATTQNERVFLNIEQGSAKAMTAELSQWQNAPDKIYLYQGEQAKTGADSRITLTYFDQSIMRLNNNSEIRLNVLKKNKSTVIIKTTLNQGEAWAKIGPLGDSGSSFAIDTSLLNIDSEDAIVSIVAPGLVRVIKGTVDVGIKYDDAVIKAVTLGIGQELNISEEDISKLNSGGKVELVNAWIEDFTKSDWYLWNSQKDGTISAYEESDKANIPAEKANPATSTTKSADSSIITPTASPAIVAQDQGVISKVVYVLSPSLQTATNKDFFDMKGHYDPKIAAAIFVDDLKAVLSQETSTWEVQKIKFSKEGINTFQISATDLKGAKIKLDDFNIIYDKTPPVVPIIIEPGLTGAVVPIQLTEQIIKGIVSADTQKVIVNDYALGKYVPGSKEFSYYAKVAYGNLMSGENQYQIFAEDKAGNLSGSAIITLVLDSKAIGDAETPTATPTTDKNGSSQPPVPLQGASSTGAGVVITDPNGGKDLTTSETFFEIKGTAPANTSGIFVNDYKLSAYQLGNAEWKYRASVQLGNLKPDQKNYFTVVAYDAKGDKLGEASLTIILVSEKLSAPVITIPTDKNSYSTNLNVITIGGTVNAVAEEVYLNGEKINYEDKSGKWRKSVTLTPGDNVFRVYATQGEQKSGVAKITIKYY